MRRFWIWFPFLLLSFGLLTIVFIPFVIKWLWA